MDVEKLWQIPNNWRWTQIKALGDVIGGGTPSTKELSYWGKDINWISPSDLTDHSSKTISHGAKVHLYSYGDFQVMEVGTKPAAIYWGLPRWTGTTTLSIRSCQSRSSIPKHLPILFSKIQTWSMKCTILEILCSVLFV